VAVNRVDYAQGVVVGYFVSWFVEDEAHLGNPPSRPDHQQRGIGQLLLDGSLDEARRRRTRLVSLEVRESNGGATALSPNGFRRWPSAAGTIPTTGRMRSSCRSI
jgi:ribosomal protein S18 acetylase RimI-like enzyme